MSSLRGKALAAALISTLACAPAAEAASPRKVFVRDFDGDGKADILWIGSGAGAWLMAGTAPKSVGALQNPANGGDVLFTGDFDGDGKTDLLWRDRVQDRYDVVLMDGLQSRGSATVSAAGSGWEAVATGDFDGDGKVDVLWKSAVGDFRATFMNGATVRESIIVLVARPELSVAAVADFDGDGRADVLWTGSDGSAHLTAMQGTAAPATRKILDGGTGWWPAMVGDFDGDGHADIVWRHADGSHGAWFMADPSAPAAVMLVGAGTGWTAKYVRDLDGDGTSDIVWQHVDGSYAAWRMSGRAPVAFGTLIGGGTGWTLVASDDYDGDGKDDFLWRHASGAYGLWLNDGFAPKAVGSLLGGGTGWERAVGYEGCDRSEPGSFTIAGSGGGTVEVPANLNSVVRVFVQRTPGTCGGAFAVRYDATTAAGSTSDFSPLGAGSIAFGDGEPGIKSVAIKTGGYGTYQFALASAQGSPATTASGGARIRVAPPTVDCAVPPATYSFPAVSGQQFVFGTNDVGSRPPLKPGETIAASFVYQPPSGGSWGEVDVGQVSNYVAGAPTDIEVAISACPNMFPATSADTACSKRIPYPSVATPVLYAPPGNSFGLCALTPGMTYFLNVRHVSSSYADGELPSCHNANGCALRMQLYNLN